MVSFTCITHSKDVALQGLGFPQLSNLKTVPVFFNMIDNGDLDEPTFALYLNPFPTAEPAGEIMFGGVNRSLFLGELFTVPVLVKTCATQPTAFNLKLPSICSALSSHAACRLPMHVKTKLAGQT